MLNVPTWTWDCYGSDTPCGMFGATILLVAPRIHLLEVDVLVGPWVFDV